MKLGILAAMEQEVKSLVESLDEYTETVIANQRFYDGTIFGKKVTLVQSGIGKVNAAIGATLLIERFGTEAIINTGSAGGINTGLSVGDLVLAEDLSYNDADARVFGYRFGQIPQMPERYRADKTIVDRVEKVAAELNWKVHRGLIVSGDSFVAGEEQVQKIVSHFPEALVTEMEGTAIAQTCHQFGIPFAVIRALSDTADEKAEVSFDEFIDTAGRQSAEMVIQFIKEF